MTDIGRAGMVMKGDYNSASTYETLDAVSYSNALYVAKQNVPAGTVPTNTTYWQTAIGLNAELTYTVYSDVTFESNQYVSPYGALYDGVLISPADVETYGIPVSGNVLITGYPSTSISIVYRLDSGYQIRALAPTAGTYSIGVHFLKFI
jgi:hypothetical protein